MTGYGFDGIYSDTMMERLSGKLSDIVQQILGKSSISEKNIQDAIDEVKIALLEADVNLRVVRRFVNQTAEEALGQKVIRSVSPGQQFIKILQDKMVKLLGDTHQELDLKPTDTTTTILLAGLQGSGKTTTAAKLAHMLKKRGRKCLLVAADLVRPAAIEQLQVLGSKIDVEVFRGSDAKAIGVVRESLEHAARNHFDTVIVDTTGRLDVDQEMMNEIERIRHTSKADEVLLVADAMTGQYAVEIAKQFDERIRLSGIILSKFDSDTRGGAALSMRSITGKPIKFIGVGEHVDGLEAFHPERIASRILGMGDVVTLVERASEAIQEEEAEELQRKMRDQSFTMEDYLEQFRKVRKMGSLESLMELIPGMKGMVSPGSVSEDEVKRDEAIILSMTPTERRNHRIVNPSRKKRIARGSGTSVFDVNRMIKKFERTKLLMRKMSRDTKYQSQMLSRLGKS